MVLAVLFERMQALQQQLANDKQNVQVLSEQLEQAKSMFHATHGRLQELAYLIQEEQKLEEAAKKVADNQQNAVMDSLEGCDGKVNEQDPE